MLAFAACALLLQPVGSQAATSLSEVNKELDATKQQIKETQQDAAEAEKRQNELNAQVKVTENSIQTIMKELSDVQKTMDATKIQIVNKEEEIRKTKEELAAAEERVKERDALIQSRMRLMYSNGIVSYLDVLLSSTSFSDFLDRFDALQSILRQDKDILAQNKADKLLIEEKKATAEKQLKERNDLFAKQNSYMQTLKEKEEQKEAMIASYKEEIEELEEISEEAEQSLIALAKKQSQLESQKKKLSSVNKPYSGGKLGMPIVDYSRVSSPFGVRIHPVTGVRKMHTGIDFAAPKGTDIFAAESGVVILAQSWSGYGNTVIIDHGNNLWTLYGHIREGGTLVSEGETVKKGQKIAEVGMTGTATGYHLHFEVRVNEEPVNPSSYLN